MPARDLWRLGDRVIMVQRINLSKLSFGDYTLGNASAAIDSQGAVGGTFTVKGPNAPAPPTAVAQFTLNENGTAIVKLAGGRDDTIEAKGTYNKTIENDVETARLLNPVITRMKIAGREVVPSVV